MSGENKLWEGTQGEGCHGTGKPMGIGPSGVFLPRIGIAAIVTRGSEILLGRSKKEPIVGKWVIPGGGVKPFEPLPVTVTRELKEETNIDIKPGAVLFVSEVLEEPFDHRIVIYVDAEYVGGDLKAGDDLSEVRWVDARNLGDLQDEMSELTIDALHKFSLILKARAMAKKQGMFGPPIPSEGYN
jgi:ADP-ribose pyrophosphatase